MKLISDESKRIKHLQNDIDIDIFRFESKYKNELEILILSYYADLLQRSDLPYPVYFEKRNNQDPPDFNIYDSNRSFMKLVEVTESMKPNRRRQKEYWANNVSIKNEYNKSNLDSLLNILKKKILAQYSNTDLIIWINIDILDLASCGVWHRIIINSIKTWINERKLNFDSCTYDNVFVIDSKSERLLKIFPDFDLIYTPINIERNF